MPPTSTRRAGLAIVAALLLMGLTPTAYSAPTEARAVGEFFVDATGRATGLNLAATIVESDGAIRGFSASGRAIFDGVTIDGFRSVEKLHGVGSSALALKGADAVLSLHDNANSALTIAADAATSARFDLASGIVAVQRDAQIVDLETKSGEWLGSLVAIDGTLSSGGGAARADLDEGGALVFLAKPPTLGDASYFRAVVAALADGALAGSVVTEWSAGAVQTSRVQVDPARSFATVAGHGAARSALPAIEEPMMLAFDLAYETLAARAAADVSVAADRVTLQRAASAEEVAALAEQRIGSYFALVEDGRAHVLAAAPAGARELVVSADARGAKPVAGDITYESNGKLLGSFLTSLVSPGQTDLRHYTTLESRTEVFRSVSVQGNRAPILRNLEDAAFRIEGSKANLTLVDDAYATLVVEGKTRADAAFTLAPGVRAVPVTPSLVRLADAEGAVGWLVALAPAGQVAPAQLDATASGIVTGTIEKGGRIVFRGATDAFASEPAVALALAEGDVGAQILAAARSGEVAASVSEHLGGVDASILSRARGSIEAQYLSSIAGATSLVLDAKGGALPVKSADDLRVIVDGVSALRVPSAESALAPSAVPRWFGETSPAGDVRVIVNTAAKIGAPARVVVETALARSAPGADAFGLFKVFQDGTAVGDFVSLHAAAEEGAVLGYSLAPHGELFGSIRAGSSPFKAIPADGAATLALENAQARLEAADATTGYLRILAKRDTTATLDLASGFVATKRAAGVVDLVDASNRHVASVVLVGGGSLSVVDGDVVARLQQGAQLVHKAHAGIEGELSNAQRAMLGEAMAKGQLVGHVLVQTGDAALETSSLGDLAPFGGVTSAVTTAYSADVQVVASAAKDRVDVTVASAKAAGKTLLVSLDAKTLPGLATGHAEILFDGLPIEAASSYADVLDALDDGDVAEYFVLAGEAGTQVLVSIPHFSVHTVTLQERASSSAGLYPYATVFLGLLVAAQSVLLIRRKNA